MRQVAAVLLWLGSAACGIGWDLFVRSTAPNHRYITEIKQRCIGSDCVVRVAVKDGNRVLFEHGDGQDRVLTAAEVYWASDSKKVVVFACSAIGSQLSIAYDVSAKSEVNSARYRSLVEKTIRNRYGIDRDIADGIAWLCSSSGVEAFQTAVAIAGYPTLKAISINEDRIVR
jgi:hypothetical protein